ncbi:TPM domain-containing protein [Sediminibacterium roseum]|uniref:TPM domain-containing protein n=1 Tax=Sediminibacterium roseum TaxID=1978412 RepID=A0ABX0A252_9BACT|nr:TPM domain-containing protein [Sediminibacterium roseum]NCI51290.1 TPM domain-containing protein [Sediminibacterium roseum]
MFDFLFKKKEYFTAEQQEQVVNAIRQAETATSGEVRIYIETKCKTAVPLERAMAVFQSLKMDQTRDRNAVLLYIAMGSRKLAVYGDEGIHKIVGQNYWDGTIAQLAMHFKNGNMTAGIVEALTDIGQKLQKHFPYLEGDKNELPDEMVFGK